MYVEQWDLSDLGSVDAPLTAVETSLGRIDVLIDNTGGPPPSPVSGQGIDLWQTWFAAMVQPVIAITDRVLPAMRDAR